MWKYLALLSVILAISFIYTKPIDKPAPVEMKDRTHKQQLHYLKYQTRDKGH